MIKIEKTMIVGWEPAIRGMRNPKNSWDKSDTIFVENGKAHYILGNAIPSETEDEMILGENDHKLMMTLRKGGADDRKYMRMIVVYADITAPLYWWKEYDTYKVGTVANSCSTMHKLDSRDLDISDFSTEHLFGEGLSVLKTVINNINFNRQILKKKEYRKDYWWQMIQMLPTSYNQKRTVMVNYEVLCNMYRARKNHKLDEWHGFCAWIESLPYPEIITGEEK